jgi:DnaK suppressor protein
MESIRLLYPIDRTALESQLGNGQVMNPEQKKELLKTIESEMAALEIEIKTFESLTRPVSPDNAIGRLTRMEAINNKSINEAALSKARDRLTRLRHALSMIDDPDFGFCSQCGEPIPYARLKIMPDSSLCVTCAEQVMG